MKKEFCRANLTGILYANRPSFLWSFLSFPPQLSTFTFHFPLLVSPLLERGQSGCRGVCRPPPHRNSWWLVCLMYEFGEGTRRWRTVEDLVKKLKAFSWLLVSGILLHTLYTLFWSLGVVDEFIRRAFRLCEFFLAGLGFFASCFCFFSCLAWLLEWNCDLKWNVGSPLVVVCFLLGFLWGLQLALRYMFF